jgi:asparagine synthase (glutamine-hydrolysing)
MCGIFAILNNDHTLKPNIQTLFEKGKNRGPEYSKLIHYNIFSLSLGFHRLAINGLNEQSNQPFDIDDILLICNGEIYNYKKLYSLINITPKTDSDCEVILHLYKLYGIEQTLIMLDGVFSFILFDKKKLQLFVARDPYGVRPLYYLKNSYPTHNTNNRNALIGFASEIKCLTDSSNPIYNDHKIEHFEPGTYSVFDFKNIHKNRIRVSWEISQENTPYFIPGPSSNIKYQTNREYYNMISESLRSAVEKRCLTTDRPIACLLSGGLDSSLITALVNDFYKTNLDCVLETYSIGLIGSEDLKYARIVADYLQTKHTEIIVTEQEMFEAIPEVIYAIESYDTTTVRASIGNYLLGKYISKNSLAKVIFNGDGSDELCGGYLYMGNCPDSIEFDKETRRLLKDIHLFDVLRSDKSISSNGLEPRTPFLDKTFTNAYLSIPPDIRFHKNLGKCEKFMLRNSFDICNYKNWREQELLPDSILWRKKEAFSDGVSGHGRSLYKILQEFISIELNLPANIETEKIYYKTIFDNFYPNMEHIIPYFWMPKYTNATDPSARTLEIYTQHVFQST